MTTQYEELSASNLKEKALKAYYASKLAAQIKADEDAKQFEIDKAAALEELKGKFPGIVDEQNGWFDILGYKFRFGVFGGHGGKFYFEMNFSSPIHVSTLEDLGKVIDCFSKEKVNKDYNEQFKNHE